MAFLDNSGDIILDAVLTDTGRYRLAKGDGSFKIAKFALADDEINYELYNKNHPSGSSYYDLEILQTPCLEAFTNNTSSVKHRLISIPRTNLMHLPVFRLNTKKQPVKSDTGAYIVAVDKDTQEAVAVGGTTAQGTLYGETPNDSAYFIRVDQGLVTTKTPPSFALDADLVESQYIIQIDNRFGSICDDKGNAASFSFVDDDQIATYYLALGNDTDYVTNNNESNGEVDAANQVITGPRGTKLQFKIKASIELNSSTYLFEKLGSTGTTKPALVDSATHYYIDSIVRVVGATTGCSVDIPVRFVKAQ